MAILIRTTDRVALAEREPELLYGWFLAAWSAGGAAIGLCGARRVGHVLCAHGAVSGFRDRHAVVLQSDVRDVWPAAHARVQGVDRGQVLGGELEIFGGAVGSVDSGMAERPCCMGQRSIIGKVFCSVSMWY